MTGSPGFVTITYGSTYNAAVGLQCLASDTFRTESMKNVEFLYDNQCAPYQWSEAFEYKGRDQWVGMYLPQESYGNYESWGTSFSKQADTSGLRLGPCRRHRVPRQRPTAVMAERRLGDRMGQRQHQRRPHHGLQDQLQRTRSPTSSCAETYHWARCASTSQDWHATSIQRQQAESRTTASSSSNRRSVK